MNNSHLHKKALKLSYFTAGYNALEGIASIAAGSLAGSAALVGFGLDSFVESMSAGVMIWRFQHRNNLSHETEERIEKRAIGLVGYSFFVLGAYILYEAGLGVWRQEEPLPSMFGILIAIVSLIVMPALFLLKHKTGKAISSRSLVADSKQTLACVMLSVTLLVGLCLNYLFGLWWMDHAAGIVIALMLFREGYKTLQEQKLCEC